MSIATAVAHELSVIKAAGVRFDEGFLHFAPVVTKLALASVPAIAVANPAVAAAVGLIAGTMLMVEQKAAATKFTGTGADKFAEVVALVKQPVESLLASVAGFKVSDATVNTWTQFIYDVLSIVPQSALPAVKAAPVATGAPMVAAPVA